MDVSTNATLGSQTSATPTVAVMYTSRWLGGQSVVRSRLSVIVGSTVSATSTFAVQSDELPVSSRAVKVTGVLPRGRKAGEVLEKSGATSHQMVAEIP